MSRGEEEMGLGRTPTIRQLCLQLDDYKSDFALPRGPPSGLGGAQDAREEENVSKNSPGAGLSPPGCFDVLQSFKGQTIPGGHQPHYITDSSASSPGYSWSCQGMATARVKAGPCGAA